MPVETSNPRIFVSYSRSDGTEIAAQLRCRLENEHGLSLWQDLTDMEGGRDWWRQITEAIDHVEYLVLVMTPAALRSKVVRDEWRYARQQGTCVIPVQGAPNIDYSSLPGWMRRAHFVDYKQPEQWTRFVRNLESPCHAPRVPLMAAEPEDDFVERRAELDALIGALLDENRDEPVAITAVLKGAGGYGKTTLARALCHDERILDAFHDGVLWVTLGQTPGDLIGCVQDLIEVLTGQRSGFKTLEASTTRLAELLVDRRLLIVVDDVWDASDLQPFLHVGKKGCARLITTRNSDTLPPGARSIPVDAMQESEAIRLLRYQLPDGEEEAFQHLATRLGEWPLLLKLVNGSLRQRVLDARQPLQDALAHVNKALDLRGLIAFDASHSEERNRAVARTLGMSLELLNDEERVRFKELAVFPQDVDVPLATLETLWGQTAGLDEFGTEHLSQRLFGLSLLSNLDLAERRIRLHDVVHSYLRVEQKGRLFELHSQLIEAYRTRCADSWQSGPNDGYFFNYLPWHLAQAGRADELNELLFDYRWMRRKLQLVGVNGLIEDLEKLGKGSPASSLSEALQLSAHVLDDNACELVSQLIGRLAGNSIPELASLIKVARTMVNRPALVPRGCALTPPGTGLIRTFRHRESVTAIAVLPKGKSVITCSADGIARLWDLEGGTEVKRLTTPNGWVRAVAVSSNGERAMIGADDGLARLWDLKSGREMGCYRHDDRVSAVAMLPDGRHAVTGSADGIARLWELESGKELRRLTAHKGWVRAVALSTDGEHAMIGADDGLARLWNLKSGGELRCYEHDAVVHSVAMLPDGRRAVTGAEDGLVRLWDLADGRELRRLDHGSWVVAVAVLPDGARAITGSDDWIGRLWNLENGEELQRFEGHEGTVLAVAVLPNGKRVITGSDDGAARLWDLEAEKEVRPARLSKSGVSALAALPDAKRAVVVSEDATLWLQDLESGLELMEFAGHEDLVNSITVLPDGKRAVTGSVDGTVKLWDLESGLELHDFDSAQIPISSFAVMPTGRQIITCSKDRTLRLWDLGDGKQLATFTGDTAFQCCALTPDGRFVVVGDTLGQLQILEIQL